MAEKFRKFANAAAAMAVSFSRPNYFESGKKGELVELRSDLNSEVTLLRKEAMKKVIASMTIGKDVSPLFAEVLMCIQTDDLELKKLVYLYLVNYSKTQPELALLAINTFIKDSEDINPLVRALAIRTMGCIRIERILDYVIEPLRRGIKDSSPYVRKTCALCIAKIFDLNAEVSEDCGFLAILQELLMTESNPMVISNVVAALSDIQELVPDLEALNMNEEVAVRLVSILTDCTEWGQVYLMDALAAFVWVRLEEVERVIETVLPKLQHSNQAVVMSAINLLVNQGLGPESILPENHQLRVVLERKLSSPLISILSPPNQPEIQFAALRVVNLLLQTFPRLFQSSEIGVFFCSYNDPQYVKLEKLEIIGKIVNDGCIERIIPELAEYAKDVDSEIVKEAIKILSQCAQSLSRWTRTILAVFAELLETNLPIILQEVTINLIPMIRCSSSPEDCKHEIFPLIESFYFSDLEAFWRSLHGGQEAAQAAFIWLLGEFTNENFLSSSEDISRNFSFFSNFILSKDDFPLEGIQFQRQALHAALKLFISNVNHEMSLRMAQEAVELGLKEGGSIDLMDCCRIYKRILEKSSSLNVAKLNNNNAFTTSEIDDWGNITSSNNDENTFNEEFSIEQLFNITNEDEDESSLQNDKNKNKNISVFLKQLTRLSGVFHRLPDEFVSARQIVVRNEPGQSPLEHSLKSLNLESSNANTSNDLPIAFTRLLRSNRPAVANLLDLSYDVDRSSNLTAATATTTTAPVSPVNKYANLLDLLD